MSVNGSPAGPLLTGEAAPRELFALTDEQILEIQPDAQDVEVSAVPPESAGESQTAAAEPQASTPDRTANAAPTFWRSIPNTKISSTSSEIIMLRK